MREIYDVRPSFRRNRKNYNDFADPEDIIRLVEEFEQQDARVKFLSTFPVSSFILSSFALLFRAKRGGTGLVGSEEVHLEESARGAQASSLRAVLAE